jgi:hypothetical protein
LVASGGVGSDVLEVDAPVEGTPVAANASGKTNAMTMSRGHR